VTVAFIGRAQTIDHCGRQQRAKLKEGSRATIRASAARHITKRPDIVDS